MGVIKNIQPIPKTFSPDFVSLESSLAKNGWYRNPGASVTKFPFKEYNGKYRTGLDEDADYLNSWPAEERAAEIERIRETRARLEKETGWDLGPRSQFYNYASSLPDESKVVPVKLGNSPEFFNMDVPLHEITWNWLRVHPTIAPSLQAVQRGDVNPGVVQYYVADDDAETAITFKRKQILNRAIGKLDTLGETPSKLRQIGRLLGLPVTEDTKQETVYNLIDTLLKSGEFSSGEHKGNNPITVFNELLALSEERAHIKDIVNEAIKTSIYRVRNNGKLFEGENEVATSKEAMVTYLLDDNNQEDLFALERKLKINKITAAS
jgi:hypothetical protein